MSFWVYFMVLYSSDRGTINVTVDGIKDVVDILSVLYGVAKFWSVTINVSIDGIKDVILSVLYGFA